MIYRNGVIAAVKRWGRRYFTLLGVEERLDVLKNLAAEVSAVYGRRAPAVSLESTPPAGVHHRLGATSSAGGIVLYRSLSFTTFLHELYHWLTIGHIASSDESLARQWSVILFARALPEEFSRFSVTIGDVRWRGRRLSPRYRLRRALAVNQPVTLVVESPTATESAS